MRPFKSYWLETKSEAKSKLKKGHNSKFDLYFTLLWTLNEIDESLQKLLIENQKCDNSDDNTDGDMIPMSAMLPRHKNGPLIHGEKIAKLER